MPHGPALFLGPAWALGGRAPVAWPGHADRTLYLRAELRELELARVELACGCHLLEPMHNCGGLLPHVLALASQSADRQPQWHHWIENMANSGISIIYTRRSESSSAERSQELEIREIARNLQIPIPDVEKVKKVRNGALIDFQLPIDVELAEPQFGIGENLALRNL